MAFTPHTLRQALLARGYTPHAAAGITANAVHESSLNPAAIGDRGTSIGLFQWHGPRAEALQRYAADKGKDWRSPDAQLDFLGHELAVQGLRGQLDASGSAEDAARLFTYHFERPANARQRADERARTASMLAGGGGGGLDLSMFERPQRGLDLSMFEQPAAPRLDLSMFERPLDLSMFEEAPRPPQQAAATPPEAAPPPEMAPPEMAPQPEVKPGNLQMASALGAGAASTGQVPPAQITNGPRGHWSTAQSRDAGGRWSGGFA